MDGMILYDFIHRCSIVFNMLLHTLNADLDLHINYRLVVPLRIKVLNEFHVRHKNESKIFVC